MEIEKLLKPRPKSHADLIEIKVEGSELFFLETLFIFLIYGQNQQNTKDIVRRTHRAF